MTYIDTLKAALDGPLSPLTGYRQFVLWRIETNEQGKPTKVPYGIDGKMASSTNPATWTDAATALQYANAWPGFMVGFVLSVNDPFRVIDIDHCYQGGQWSPLAYDVIAQFPGAAVEVSQSGEGLHVWLQGELPADHGNVAGGLELYAKERFIALTGAGLNAGTSAGTVFPNLREFVQHRFPPKQRKKGEKAWNVGPIPEAGNVPDDDELLLKMFLSQPAAQPQPSAWNAFANLHGGALRPERVPVSNADVFNANVEVLAQAWPSDKGDAFDHSNAAFSLASRLAYWTGKDCPRIERLMNRAAFKRARAEVDHTRGTTYMQHDIMNACAGTENVRHWVTVEQRNEEVKQANEDGYNAYYDRIASVGDVVALRAICEEVGYDYSIDKHYRELLAQHVRKCVENLGEALPIANCRALVAQRASRTTPDLRELTRRENIALSLPEDTVVFAPVMPIAQMVEEFVFIGEGSIVGSRSDRHMVLSLSDFTNVFAASRTVVPDGSPIIHTAEWLKYPSRKFVQTRTFHAGAPVLTVDPLGRTALNAWRPIERHSAIMVDVSPFLEHVHYLFGASSDRFLDWLAHIEQQPGVLPHFGWLHVADSTGTGRGWLASIITRLWRNYVAPSVDMDGLVGGSFNGVLAGKLIAIVDEIRAGAREDAYMMEGRIRSMLTEEVRYVKPKYGREYSEHNACRWLVCSNHKNAIPLSITDRRWDVVHKGGAPRSPATYEYLYELRKNPAFIESVAAWLRARDLSRFKPGDRPPITEAKRKAIEASTSDFQRIANNIVRVWPADFITMSDLVQCMYEGDPSAYAKRPTSAMKHALEDAGMVYLDKQLRIPGGQERFRGWIVRDADRWIADTSMMATGPELLKMKAATVGQQPYQLLLDRL